MKANDQQRKAFYSRQYQYCIIIWDAPDERTCILCKSGTFEIVVKEKTLSELVMALAIQGYDLNMINFNKVAMHPEVKKFLRAHRIDHLEWEEKEDKLQEVVVCYE